MLSGNGMNWLDCYSEAGMIFWGPLCFRTGTFESDTESYRLSKSERKEQGRYVDDFPIVPSHTLTFNRWLVDIWKKLNHPPYPPIHHCLDLPWFLYNKKVVLSMFTQKIRREDFQCSLVHVFCRKRGTKAPAREVPLPRAPIAMKFPLIMKKRTYSL